MGKKLKRAFGKNKKKTIALPMAAVILILVLVCCVQKFLYISRTQADTSEGRAKLSEMASEDVAQVQTEIQTLQDNRDAAAKAAQEEAAAQQVALEAAQAEQEAAAQQAEREEAEAQQAQEEAMAMEDWLSGANALADAGRFKEIFSNSVVVGDSIVSGILQCDLMYESSVVYEVGYSLMEMDEDEYLSRIQALYPEKIFVYLGFNDVGQCDGDYERFYKRYVHFIKDLQEYCPGVQIYANQLFHPLNLDTIGIEYYNDIDSYNQIIAQVCQEYGLVLIENGDLVKEEYYYKDGYHFLYPFYPGWLRRMAEVAGLL